MSLKSRSPVRPFKSPSAQGQYSKKLLTLVYARVDGEQGTQTGVSSARGYGGRDVRQGGALRSNLR